MVVLHVITRLVTGGAAKVVLDQCALLHGAGWTVHLAAGPETGSEGSAWPEAEKLAAAGVLTLHRVPPLVRQIAPINDLRALSALKGLIRKLSPDVVHSHTSKAGLLGTTAARRLKVRRIVLSPHGHIFNREARIPGVPSGGLRRWLMEKMAVRSVRFADVVTCPNRHELRDGVRYGVWDETKARVVPNGIDVGRYVAGDRSAARERFRLPTDAKLLGVVARLTTEKGVDIAIEALPLIPEWRLVVAGDGPEREALEQLAQSSGVADRVHWLGRLDDVAGFYPALDALAVPSRTEAHGLVATEAMACGIPVVAARVGGLPSLVIEAETGTLFAPGEPKSLAAGVLWLAEQPPEIFRGCREWVERKWSHDAMIEGLLHAYEHPPVER